MPKVKRHKQAEEDDEDAVCQVLVERGSYNEHLPHLPAKIVDVRGSGFVIEEIPTGLLVVTNAHVVNNAKTICVKFSKTRKKLHTCQLLVFCPYRDVALLLVETTDLHPKPLKFADSFLVKAGDQVHVIAHPLGEWRVQRTSGTVSGFSTHPKNNNIVHSESSYIQITAGVNPGSSGSCCVNSQNEVIGLTTAAMPFASNVGYITPASTVIATLFADRGPCVMMSQPHLGLETSPGPDGVYVRWVTPLSSFRNKPYMDSKEERVAEKKAHGGETDLVNTELKRLDVITDLVVFSGQKKLHFVMDQYGLCHIENRKEVKRPFTIVDISACIDTGSQVELHITRAKKKLTIKGVFSPQPCWDWMMRDLFVFLEPWRLGWAMLGGMLLVENVDSVAKNTKNCYQRHVHVCRVFQNSFFNNHELEHGQAIKEINGTEVHTLADVCAIMQKASSYEVVFTNQARVKVASSAASAKQSAGIIESFLQ